MKKYIGVKMIEAEPMDQRTFVETIKNSPYDSPISALGYKVVYPDGYVSWSPEDVFEEAYRECDHMTFGLAVEAMKKGHKVARKGWNGKGMFLCLADDIDFHTNANLGCVSHVAGALVNPSVVMKTADNKFVVGWLASQTDILAEDWVIIE